MSSTNQLQFFRIDVNSNPQYNLAITPHVAGGNIITAVGGQYTRWNYNSDKSISSYYDPAYVIAPKNITKGSELYTLPKTTATYKEWTWNPSTKTFTLDANPQLMMTVDGATLADYKNVVLGDNTATYYQWNIVPASPNMPNISIATKSNPSLVISADAPTKGIPAPTPYIAPKTAKYTTWNYNNMQLLPIGTTKEIGIYNDTYGTFLDIVPSKTSPNYNSYIWTWNENEETFTNELTKKKMGVNDLKPKTIVGTKNPAYLKWIIICKGPSGGKHCQNTCVKFPELCGNGNIIPKTTDITAFGALSLFSSYSCSISCCLLLIVILTIYFMSKR